MRSKEEAHDYRYFPDPDLPGMILEDSFIEAVRQELPELPDVRKVRFETDFLLSGNDASQITADRNMADYFETVCGKSNAEPKMIANWMLGDFSAALNKSSLDIRHCLLDSDRFASLLNRIADNTISGKIAKEVFALMWDSHQSVDEIIEQKGLKQITDTAEIEAIVDLIVEKNAQQVKQYQDGNQKVFGFFVGQVMKETRGKANPKQVNELLKKKLD